MIIKDKFHHFSKIREINFTMLKKKTSRDLVYLFMKKKLFFFIYIYTIYKRIFLKKNYSYDLFFKFLIFICLKKKILN